MDDNRRSLISGFLDKIFSGTSATISVVMALIGGAIIYFGINSKSDAFVFLTVIAVGCYIFWISAKIYFSELKAPDVIPEKDREFLVEIIKDNGKDGIDTYIKLSSLYGFTGTITKLGLTGLPLLTVALTIFFTVLGAAMLALNIQDSTGFVGNVMDLSKLTLGAFIGSFVQRNVSAAAAVSSAAPEQRAH